MALVPKLSTDPAALAQAERGYREIYETLTDGIYRSSIDGRQLSANPALVGLNGFATEAEMLDCLQDIGADWYVDPDRRGEFQRLIAEHGSVHDFISEVYRFRTHEKIWVSENARLVRDPDTNEPMYYEGTIRDVTETVRRLELEARFRKIADTFEGMLFELRVAGDQVRLEYASPGLARLFAVEPAAARRDPWSLLAGIEGAERTAVLCSMARAQSKLSRWTREFRRRGPNGDDTWLLGDATPERQADGAVLWHGYLTDVPRRKRSEQQIHRLGFFDPLTRLGNRRLLLDRLAEVAAAHSRTRRHGAILFVDLDRFKSLNDTRGHDAGDLLLIEIARRLQACVRTHDLVARLGGDEFVVLLADLPSALDVAAAEVERIAERVVGIVEEPWRRGDLVLQITASIGVALFGPDDAAHDAAHKAILQRADMAMYQVKAAGRNGFRFFDPDMRRGLHDRMAVAAELRDALSAGDLQFHVERQVDASRRVFGAEALLRWRRPDGRLRETDGFLPVAEESGLVDPTFEWVLREIGSVLAGWHRDPTLARLRLSVDLGVRQLYDPEFLAHAKAALAGAGPLDGRLMFEVTEDVMLDNPARVAEGMRALRALGARFSLDHFGTGFASLSRLRQLPIDEIKIDQTLVGDLGSDGPERTFVRAIVALGRGLGATVMAAGVESETQFAVLAEEGCAAFQGSLFGRPEAIGAFATG